jgi:putative aminopeptidase FrvX
MFANVVQEEVGLRGAHMICQNYKPNFAIVIDVTHDTSTPMMNVKKNGSCYCGGGPIIPLSPVVHPMFFKFIKDIADKNKIKFQRKALGKSTGTDADNYASHGIVTALISIPMRYMHTKVEMVHSRDVEKTIDLIYNLIINLKEDTSFSLIKN